MLQTANVKSSLVGTGPAAHFWFAEVMNEVAQ
jgi:hypothetical protein